MTTFGFSAAFVVLLCCTGTVLSQTQECLTGLETCTGNFATNMQLHAQGGQLAMLCDDLSTFVTCLREAGCPMDNAQVSQTISQSSEQLATLGINCDGGPGAGPDAGAGTGMGAGIPNIPEACAQGIQACTTQIAGFIKELGENNMPDPRTVCSKMKEYETCMTQLSCPMTDEQREQITSQMTAEMKQNELDCEQITSEGGSGGQTNSMMQLYNLNQMFMEKGCKDVFESCSQEYSIDPSSNPSCEELKKSGTCMFTKCEALKDGEDGNKAAELLIGVAKSMFQCDVKASEIRDNGNNGQTSVHQPLLLTALVTATAFFINKMRL